MFVEVVNIETVLPLTICITYCIKSQEERLKKAKERKNSKEEQEFEKNLYKDK